MKEQNVRTECIKVYLSQHDKTFIKNTSKSLGLTESTFLRNLGIGFQPTSILDQDAVLKLVSINTAQTRLGNLLALALKNPEKMSLYTDNDIAQRIDFLVEKIHELQLAMLDVVGSITEKKKR